MASCWSPFPFLKMAIVVSGRLWGGNWLLRCLKNYRCFNTFASVHGFYQKIEVQAVQGVRCVD